MRGLFSCSLTDMLGRARVKHSKSCVARETSSSKSLINRVQWFALACSNMLSEAYGLVSASTTAMMSKTSAISVAVMVSYPGITSSPSPKAPWSFEY